MIHLIDKDILDAEIERLKKEEGQCQVGKDTADVYYARGFRFACERIINVLDIFEVKEVDLEKELDSMLIPELKFHKALPSLFDVAKHFFELGLSVGNSVDNKAQKGE